MATTAYVVAQVAPNAPPNAPQNVAPGVRQGENLDANFAHCLILENQNEIALAKMAQQKAESSGVKEFVDKLIRDHQQFLQQLEKFGGMELKTTRAAILEGRQNPVNPNPPNQPNQIQNQPNQIQNQNQAQPQPQNPNPNLNQATVQQRFPAGAPGVIHTDKFLQIKHEMADECLTSARRELEGKSGHEFEMCFLGMQIGMHMQMADQLKVLERHASPQLQSILHEGRETTERHLSKAKELMRDVERVRTASNTKSTEKQ